MQNACIKALQEQAWFYLLLRDAFYISRLPCTSYLKDGEVAMHNLKNCQFNGGKSNRYIAQPGSILPTYP